MGKLLQVYGASYVRNTPTCNKLDRIHMGRASTVRLRRLPAETNPLEMEIPVFKNSRGLDKPVRLSRFIFSSSGNYFLVQPLKTF